jgi:hypothetical protein
MGNDYIRKLLMAVNWFAVGDRINKVIHCELLFTTKKKTLVDLVNDRLG